MLLHRVGEVVVSVAPLRFVARLHLFYAGRRQGQDLHIDAGSVHFRQPFGTDVTESIEHLWRSGRQSVERDLRRMRRTIEKFRVAECSSA